MKKQTLHIEFDLSFQLIGISCHLRDYRFAWNINKTLGVDFSKKEVFFDGRTFSKFEYFSDPEYAYIFANKGREGFLIKNKKNVDYWLVFSPTTSYSTVQVWQEQLRKIKSVLVVYNEENKKIKEHFIF